MANKTLSKITIQHRNDVKATWESKNPILAKGVANGVATLDGEGKIPSTQLPSYVDDVVEGYYYNGKFYQEDAHTNEVVAMTSKIYVDLSTNKTYRYGGSTYVEITSGDMVALTNAEIDTLYAEA